MQAYIIRRVLLIIPTLLVVTMIVFLASRLIPGDVIDLLVIQTGTQQITKQTMDEVKEEIRHKLGLDAPFHVQYGRWLGQAFRGDLGTSLWTGIPTTKTLFQKVPVSFELGTLALIIAMIIAFPIGIYSAIRQDTIGDYVARSFAMACIALPSFWLGTMVMIYPSLYLNWSPPVGYVSFLEDPVQNLSIMMIPAFILGMVLSGTTMRMTRTMMLEVLRQDYIRTAWSKGLKERVVLMRHALKNALIPVVSIVGTQLPVIVAGTPAIEQIFNIPGIGRFLIDTLNYRDYAALSAINLFVATGVLAINLLVDLSYAYLDPRIRYK